MRARLHLGEEALDLVIEVLSCRIDGHTNRIVCRSPQSFAGPIRSLVQPGSYFHQADGIDFVDRASFPDGGRVTCDCQEIANASDAPRPKQSGLQPDEGLVAGGA